MKIIELNHSYEHFGHYLIVIMVNNLQIRKFLSNRPCWTHFNIHPN